MGNVAIIDSGGANIASLTFALARLGFDADVTTDPSLIVAADRVILPGVGAAKDAMQRLRDASLIDVIRQLKQPVLGICLGLQLLSEGSDEENVECLGVFDGRAAKLPGSPQLPVPNMGWCQVHQSGGHPIFDGISDGSYFYFVHSYAVPVSEQTVATADHAKPFSAVIANENFAAAQFHPERSSTAGARLLSNFMRWAP
jgi:glutamine amidotransferase